MSYVCAKYNTNACQFPAMALYLPSKQAYLVYFLCLSTYVYDCGTYIHAFALHRYN